MSSRAAASRKRLAGEDKRPSSSKGFFSRSKSATVAPQTVRAPFVGAPQAANHTVTHPAPYNPPLDLGAEMPHTRRNSVDTISPRKTSGPLSPTKGGPTYPSPPHQEFQAIRITPNTSHGIPPPSRQEHSVPYLEASYQPPPPIIATYQPPPPIHFTTHYPPQSVSQEQMEPLSGIESLSGFPAPPNYPPPVPSSVQFNLPSPSTSPPRSSLLLRSSQPTSRNESPIPTYTSSHIPLPPERYAPPPLQVSIQNLPQAHYQNGNPAYPSPPPSSPNRLPLSPSRVSQNSLSTDSGSSDYETGYGSRESGRSSRSVAKPKVSKKAGNLRVRQESDVGPVAPNSPRLLSANGHASSSVQRIRSIPDTASATSSNSSSSSGSSNGSSAAPPSGYVFPSGRSRAQPSKAVSKKRSGKLSGDEVVGERTRFMGILLKKKKKSKDSVDPLKGLQTTSSATGTGSKSDDLWGSPSTANDLVNERTSSTHLQPGREGVKRIKSRIGSYPLDPYNSVLLDNDRLTGELLARINPTASPSFYNYGNTPPTSVLDLGCGQGYWVVDAASPGKAMGQKVYCLGLMSKVLREISALFEGTCSFRSRRLKFGSHSSLGSVAPQLDITIPSASFTTFSIFDGQTTNPGLGSPSADSILLQGVEEEEADDDTRTVNEYSLQPVSNPSRQTIDEDSILDALAEYERFLRHRLNPPPLSNFSGDGAAYQGSDTASIHDSIAESVSPDDREEMWNIQFELQEHFGWERPSSVLEEDRPDTPTTPRLRPIRKDSTPTISTFPGTMSSPIADDSLPSPVSTFSSGTFETSSNSLPFYSKDELTHVRTFKVYEAFKLDSALFGTAI
ncbi:hypothetical protein CPB84DRAFT_1750517 [Gymnopilus junonius]|uniref:Methyltransferase domain-containing protein n=1 Tax=Gymnopilus junonius TaxID=109634 RepID=A0A9P5TJZ2_GYMJU|nr:hypothetical protein CPB84DRAFT_1750517 [Gymnopilus junonius]